jgi:predicted Zn-dependent protease
MPLILTLFLWLQAGAAREAMRAGRFAEAAKLYSALAKANPAEVGFQLNAGLAHYSARQYPAALAAMKLVLKQAPDHPAANLVAGASLLKLNQGCSALTYLKRAASLSDTPEYASQRAEAEAACGNAAAAADWWRQLLAKDSRNPRGWYGLGLAQVAQGEESAAQESFARLTALGPSPELRRLERDIARGLWTAGRYAEARQALERVKAQGVREASLEYELGDTVEKLEGPAAALTHYQAALRLDPKLAVAHGALGRALAALQRPAEAIPHLEAAARAGIDKSLWLALANAYRAVGRSADARAALQKGQ